MLYEPDATIEGGTFIDIRFDKRRSTSMQQYLAKAGRN
jgi:hypothetical protein